ncbi:MAG TPA: TetR/AcrR family transcriptional regulator [Xanthobacteraceae bacterium]|nr:TetR/AcrR family transcriptional regulator [Xanthobacteraceae bacterium]
MARKPKSKPVTRRAPSRERPARAASDDRSQRARIIDAFMALLAEKPIEQVGLAEIAKAAGVSLAELRDEFGSSFAILAAYVKQVDRAVLAGEDADMAEEPPRERLFDVLMRRIELLTPHKEAVRSLMRSAMRNPGLALALQRLALRSQQWMLTAADIGAAGPLGFVRAQGLAVLFASVLRTWIDDDDPGLARTMAALDRALARGQRWSGLLDELCRIPSLACRLRSRRRRPADDADEETVAV